MSQRAGLATWSREAQTLAWDIDTARSRGFEATTELRRINDRGHLTPSLKNDLVSAITVMNSFTKSATHARDYAIMLGWSGAMGQSASFDRAVVAALENRLALTATGATTVDVELRYLRSAAMNISRSGAETERVMASTFAVEVERIRRYFTLSWSHVDMGSTGRMLSTLVLGAELRLAGSELYNPPGVIVDRLIQASATILPSGDRERYREEFWSEATELFGWSQHLYAFRLFGRCWSLRSSLRKRDEADI
jgi:hypothetical protein